MLTEMAGELRRHMNRFLGLTKEEKTALKKQRKQLKELEEHRDKLQNTTTRLDTLQDRTPIPKRTRTSAFMRMGGCHAWQPDKASFKPQIGTEPVHY